MATNNDELRVIELVDVFHYPAEQLFRVSFEYDESMAEELEEFYDMNETFLVSFDYGDYLEKVADIKMVVEYYDTPGSDHEPGNFGITLKVSEDDYGLHTIDTSEAVFKLFSKVIHTAFEEGSKDYNYVKITVKRND